MIISTIYFNLNSTRKYLALVGVVGSFLSPLTGTQIPAALADERIFNGSSAFLTVQPVTMDEKDNGIMALQDSLFFKANSRLVASSVKSPAVVKASSNLAPKPSNSVVIVTAYSSTPDQTDDSPFITANGTYVRDGIVATNFLPFGTKVKFPEYSGDKIFIVADRMAKKNSHKIDIWMPSRGAAMNFGVKKLAYEVVE